MSQLKLLPGGAGELFVDFFGHRCRAVVVDGVTLLAAVDVGAALGLTGDGAQITRGVPDEEKGLISIQPKGFPQDAWGITMSGAVTLALSRRRGAPGGIREKLDAAMVALATGAAPAAPAIAAQEIAALHAKIDALTALVRAIPVVEPRVVARLVAEVDAARDDVRQERKARERTVAVALLERVRAHVEVAPLDAELDVRVVAAACGEPLDRAGLYRVAAALSQVGWVRGRQRREDGRVARTWTRPATVTEADVLRALRAERGPVGADVLAARYRWRRTAVRELLARLGDAGRVRYVRERSVQGWEIVPEVV